MYRGVGYGALWGAALGAVSVTVFVVVNLIAIDDLGALGAIVIYGPLAAIPGATAGAVVGTVASIALVLSGPNIRCDLVRSRIVGGAASAIPAPVAKFAFSGAPESSAGWAGLAAFTVTAVIAGAALAPRVASGPATTHSPAEEVSM